MLAGFEEETGIKITLLEAGDAGSMVSQAILTKDNPIADVMFGIDNTFLSRALEEGLFIAYESPALATVDASLQLDAGPPRHPHRRGKRMRELRQGRVGGGHLADPAVPRRSRRPRIQGPRSWFRTRRPRPPGLAFLLSTIAEFPEGSAYTWQDYWRDLVANEVVVTSGWEEAYLDLFAGGGSGDRSLVVSYASSPPAGVFFAGEPVDEAPTGSLVTGCFRQIEFAGIISGTDVEPTARDLIDYMLSIRFQEDIPLNMFVFPANGEAALPDVFVKHAAYPANPNSLDPAVIADNREAWIEAWTAIVQ